MWATFSTFKVFASSSRTYAFLVPLKGLFVMYTFIPRGVLGANAAFHTLQNFRIANPFEGFMSTASERELIGRSGILGTGLAFLRESFLTGTSTHSSGFLIAVTSGLILGFLSRFRGSGVDLSAGGGVWLLSSKTSFLGVSTSFIFCKILSFKWHSTCSM